MPTFGTIDASTAYHWLQDGSACLIDVREPEELAEAAIPGAVSLPMSEVALDSYPAFGAEKIVVVCHSGMRSARVAGALVARGVPDVYNLEGGILAWIAAGLPVSHAVLSAGE